MIRAHLAGGRDPGCAKTWRRHQRLAADGKLTVQKDL